MLQKAAVSEELLALIYRVQDDPELKDFLLVGGTALALLIGHRKSVDIDLFTRKDFDAPSLLEHMEKTYNFAVNFQARSTLKGSIEGIQLDLITHNYPLVSSPLSLEGIRMVSPEDIAAMKVNAIAGDGTRSKDFIDVYFLLKDYSFKQIIEFFSVKYNSRNNAHAVKSMTWFDDVDKADWPVMVREPDLTFARVRSEIVRHRDIYLAGEGLIRGS